MPAWQAADTLEAAVRSALRQSFDDLEVLVVDDGSTDGTHALLDRLGATDRRLRVLRRPHAGIVDTLNAGLEAARGPLIARLDADDVMHRDRLRLQIAALRAGPDGEATVLGTQIRIFPVARRTPGNLRYERWQNALLTPEALALDLLVEQPLAHPSLLAPRGVFEALGGYRPGLFPEDYDLLIRWWLRGGRLAKVPRVLTLWRDQDRRLTRVDPRCAPEAHRRLKAAAIAEALRLGAMDPDRPLWIWGAGQAGRRFLRALEAEQIFVERAVDIDPRKIGRRLRSGRVPVVAADALPGAAPRPFVLVCVAAPGARAQVRAALQALGYQEGADFRAVT